MMSTLSEYGVSAVCPNDDIFEVPRTKRAVENTTKVSANGETEQTSEIKAPPADFDSRALKIYKKIPISQSCSIESLVSDDMTLREVMKSLLKLEMNGFIRMLPGEMVSRKTN